jgi:apolipoprotein N-acyltransferase
VPVLFGVVTHDGRGGRWNSAYVATPDGRLAGPSDKRSLVLGSERIPLKGAIPDAVKRKFPALGGGFEPGERPGVLEWGPARAGVLNCFEDTIPVRSREAVVAGANILVNVTNDAWFGDTSEPREHLALAVLRSVENRRDLVRSVNTGVSALVEATGRVRVETETFTRAGIVADARLLEGRTFYSAAGDWIGWAAIAALAAMLGMRLLTRRRLDSA